MFTNGHSLLCSLLLIAMLWLPCHHVQIEVFASNQSDLEKWDGWVRSRIRVLVRFSRVPGCSYVASLLLPLPWVKVEAC